MINGQVDNKSVAGAAAIAIVGIAIGIYDASASGDLIYSAIKITTDSTLLGGNLFVTVCIIATVCLVAMAMYGIRCMV